MSPSDRRSFLKHSAAGLASVSGLGTQAGADETTPLQATPAKLPPEAYTAFGAIPAHRPLMLPGIHAYSERSVQAGETVYFRVSSDVPYVLEVCRLAGDVDDPQSNVVLGRFEQKEPRQQPIHPGSYVHVEKGLPSDAPLKAFSIECWVRPWRLNAEQGIISQHDFAKSHGVALFLDDQGRVKFYLGEGKSIREAVPEVLKRLLTGPKLNHRRWNHIVGTYDGNTALLLVNGRQESVAVVPEVRAGEAPLRLGALGADGVADRFLDGDLAMPVIYAKALSMDEVMERIKLRGLTPPELKDVLACWPLAEENGEVVSDIGPEKREGKIINHGTWMIGGPSFNGDRVGRYDTAYDPTKDEQRGHGLRLADDNLFDSRWRVSHEWQVPADSKSDVYVGRFRYEADGKPLIYHATFIVRRSDSRPKAAVVVLVSSSTWMAYSATSFAAHIPPRPFFGTDRAVGAQYPDGAPAYCCYRDHAAGQPTYYIGKNMPWPSAAPDVLYSSPQVGYSHLMRGELFTHRWLDGLYGDHGGYKYDVVTDADLDRDPKLLNGYKTIVINGHSEYWSAPAMEGLTRYFQAGGTAVVLSGNTMFWRTSFDHQRGIMECRKFDPRIGGRGGATTGELYHSQDKRRGSLMRECGYPAWQYIGLDCIGWEGTNRQDFRVYSLTDDEHFLLNQPEKVELKNGESFGHGPGGALPRAIGHEWDVRLPTLARVTRKIPEGATLPKDEPPGITTLATAVRPGGGPLDYFTANVHEKEGVCAEMIYWKRADGGQVFNAGSIAAGWALSGDPKLRTLMRNVLAQFGVKPGANIGERGA